MNAEEARHMLRIVSGIHIVFASLMILVLLLVAMFVPFLAMTDAPRHAAPVIAVVLSLVFVVLIATLIVQIGVFRLRPWARVPGIVVAALNLLSFPIGTILGALEIWLLAFNEESIRLFEEPRKRR